ncbi:hypothetical protein SARC_08106 [Sphaeroforma arctica JP610]|uniref:Uncharacterized protein n=1 Tax=Sphaeroforma arctica JP610 TaxID=667725 RepID=A0A0L0FRW6_9EUKA|nr:hypothetical protein SARC_08106 [Sphaeroforma arctica JP610]KNC79500.1 hypothetical protein SARC_08106 [Sphaeroforma arctica JP610]|eukprot:XP_014153402.1 hypothetical protein SARC_08106 [Sphaeroforma arctica JP610]
MIISGIQTAASAAVQPVAENSNWLWIKWRLALGDHIDTKYSEGKTALHLGSQNGYSSLIIFLLDQNADVDILSKEGLTALHYASQAGNLDAVRLLVDASARIDILNKDDNTALDVAKKEGHNQVVKVIEHRALDLARLETIRQLSKTNKELMTHVTKTSQMYNDKLAYIDELENECHVLRSVAARIASECSEKDDKIENLEDDMVQLLSQMVNITETRVFLNESHDQLGAVDEDLLGYVFPSNRSNSIILEDLPCMELNAPSSQNRDQVRDDVENNSSAEEYFGHIDGYVKGIHGVIDTSVDTVHDCAISDESLSDSYDSSIEEDLDDALERSNEAVELGKKRAVDIASQKLERDLFTTYRCAMNANRVHMQSVFSEMKERRNRASAQTGTGDAMKNAMVVATTCDKCDKRVTVSDGLFCQPIMKPDDDVKRSSHFLCGDCIGQHVQASCPTKREAKAESIEVHCVCEGCDSHPYTTKALARVLNEKDYGIYMACVLRHAEYELRQGLVREMRSATQQIPAHTTGSDRKRSFYKQKSIADMIDADTEEILTGGGY